ncbi:DUF3168 domain-containing protein [Primorskyibacter marinus]|uniref:DUF3168 domain-containing protein n=1 Tax=Primorskyibacter marinus TaxID=1977320 RepID=UPI000E305243|nr:DUF3168 domain-containing protein [Primorskyibacter marinus]
MSYALSAPLQSAVYGCLLADAGVQAAVGAHVYDALPSGRVPDLYVTLGAEVVRDKSDATGAGAEHDLTITVVTGAAGFQQAKEAAAAISDALNDPALTLSRGRLVGMRFLKAQAARVGTGTIRRIDLKFRARVEDN